VRSRERKDGLRPVCVLATEEATKRYSRDNKRTDRKAGFQPRRATRASEHHGETNGYRVWRPHGCHSAKCKDTKKKELATATKDETCEYHHAENQRISFKILSFTERMWKYL
jgi:hypothetical protein